MAIPNIMQTGRSGMEASRAAIATTGHNISNANTEGYTRQRVLTNPADPNGQPYSKNRIGTGTKVSRIERLNDQYVEKHLRNGAREMAHFEEKDLILRQAEDIFNEMNGDGLNRLISKFFNEFRKLSEEPENQAIRESVREASQAMVNDFHRLRHEVVEVAKHADARIEGYITEVNALSEEVRDLNRQIQTLEAVGGPPNDLLDRRDLVLKKLGTYMEISMHPDKHGAYLVDINNVGPMIAGVESERFAVERTPADEDGKPENAFDIQSTASAKGVVTHQIKGGKLGALVEARDKTLSVILDRLDGLAFQISESVNEIHRQGFTAGGFQNVNFFNPVEGPERAAELLSLSDPIKDNINNIATAAIKNAPGDNRIAIAISRLQGQRIMNDGGATIDDFYNSIIADVGVVTSRNRFAMSQQKDIMAQLNKVREQISGVSIDEETANLLQYQNIFGASAKVVQIADDMLKTVLELKRW